MLMKLEGRSKAAIFIIALISSILIILSQNFGTLGPSVAEFFDWSMYYAMIDGTVFVSWQDSFFGVLLPFLAYFPAIAGILGVLSSLLFLKGPNSAKLTFKITGLLAIIGFVIYVVLNLIWSLLSSEIPLPNLPGGYFCLIPGILILILSFMIKKPDYMKGHAREDKEYYAIGGEPQGPVTPSVRAPTVACPKCGAMISADQTFCESCGEFL